MTARGLGKHAIIQYRAKPSLYKHLAKVHRLPLAKIRQIYGEWATGILVKESDFAYGLELPQSALYRKFSKGTGLECDGIVWVPKAQHEFRLVET